MSEFSELFYHYVHDKDLSMPQIAKFCKIDRSTVYKIMQGKRTPQDEGVVHTLSRALQLNPQEEEQFLTAYQISLIGRDYYYRRKNVYALLKSFSEAGLSKDAPLQNIRIGIDTAQDTDSASKPRGPVSLFNGANAVHDAIASVILEEAAATHGHIRMCTQPDEKIMYLLRLVGEASPDFTVDHVFCLDNSNAITPAGKDYNLSCLQHILPLYTSRCTYNTYYRYARLSDEDVGSALYPSLILSSSAAVEIYPQAERCAVYRAPEMLEFFSAVYERQRMGALPLFRKMAGLEDCIEFVGMYYGRIQSFFYIWQMMPCLTFLLTREHMHRYMTKGFPNQEAFIEQFCSLIDLEKSKMLSLNTIYICTLDGIRHFLDTGMLYEYPSEYYSPLELSTRIELIEGLIAALPHFQFRLLKDSMGFRDTHSIALGVTDNVAYLEFYHQGEMPIYLVIEEAGLIRTFEDYLSSLNESDYYPPEEGIKLLRELLRKYKK